MRTVRGGRELAAMSVDEARLRNQHKAEAEAEQGPVREDPTTSPIGDAIQDFHTRGDLAFGIPAHRAGTGDVRPDAAEWAGEQAFRADVGMNNGVDNRHQSWQASRPRWSASPRRWAPTRRCSPPTAARRTCTSR